ncbi:MAG TPA: asparagine synthase (glutamine-hydrolyzing) [Elusimicrobia bacterium]|nr:asparagine synthase (glutamine-hydrolyzing) [Elusimicrobiota bacterium]HBT61326.1 asparagine synthase (glutamine-hydrolyzing) [Elusimicrobiota bacterium]
MCGICGQFNIDNGPVDREAVRRMRARLAHRGPDDEGELYDGPAGLGFRRLSILDLDNGHQPMVTQDGRYAIAFNGEIYNHPALRRELEGKGARFRTRSDTETILELFAREGAQALARLSGMFALALWDRQQRRLTLARDPMGVKPLYYRFDGKSLAFASELRAIMAWQQGWALDPAGVLDYLAYGKVHTPRTVLRDVLKLPPATALELDAKGLRLHTYWRLPRHRGGRPAPLSECVDQLDRLLQDAVRDNCLSDVPVGAFLSGGVDSALVAALMARQAGPGRVQTFSVGFSGGEPGLDESSYARIAARHAGTEHHELLLPANVLEQLAGAVDLLDEPIADSAILPTFLLARFARQRVKVVLTGEGADELFAGYDRYKAAWVNEGLQGLPAWGRKMAAPLARRLGKGAVFERLPIDDARQWAQATASSAPEDLRAVLSPDFWEASRHIDALEWLKDFEGMDHLNDALAFDLKTVLCDSLLMKVDKSTMMASLEARVPFLDKAVVEFAAGLPSSFKIRLFKGKYLLRLVARRYLPESIVWRRKHGFIVPWEAWVRDAGNRPLQELLADSAFAGCGIFDMSNLKAFHQELVRGSREIEAGLFFRIAVFGLWLKSLDRERQAAL